jgi:hypothetical protein
MSDVISYDQTLQKNKSEFLSYLNNFNPSAFYEEASENIDRSHSSNAVFFIASDPSLSLFLKNWALPGRTIGELSLDRRSGLGNPEKMIFPGDSITLNDLNLTFFTDEKLIIYEKLVNISMLYHKSTQDFLLNACLLLYTNTKEKCFLRVPFYYLWIQSIGDLMGDSSAPTDLSFDVTFRVSSFSLERDMYGV